MLFALTSFYICFDIYLEGSEFDKKQIQFLSLQLEQKKLELQLATLEQGNSHSNSYRKIASVDSEAQKALGKMKHKDVDMSEFYFLRMAEFKRQKKYKEALGVIDKIKNSTADEENLARADYESIAIQCLNYKLNENCIDTLDNMVNSYPMSQWTGKGLRWLSKLYSALNRKDEARKIDQILKTDFKNVKVE